MFNKREFKIALVKSNKTVEQVAEMLKVNKSTIYRKMNGESEFNRKEIQSICDFLKIDNPMDIFFSKNDA